MTQLLFSGLAMRVDALAVDIGAFGELLVPAQHIAERHDRFDIVRVFLDQSFEVLFRLVRLVERIEIDRHLDGGVAMQRRIRPSTRA